MATLSMKSKDTWHIVDIISLMWFSSYAHSASVSNSVGRTYTLQCASLRALRNLERLRIGYLSNEIVRETAINRQNQRLDQYHLWRCSSFSTNVSAIAFSSFVKHSWSLSIIVNNIHFVRMEYFSLSDIILVQ